MSVEELPRSSPGERGSDARRARSGILLPVLFAVYLALLTWIVIWKLEIPFVGTGDLRQLKLVPFAPSACDGASAPSEVVVNVLLFVPFGVYLGLLAPAWSWWRSAAALAGASLAMEVVQYVLAVGSSDVTDLVTNTAGGLAGLGVLALARRKLGPRASAVMSRICAVLTVLALLAAAIVVVSPLSFSPPRDVLVAGQDASGERTGAASVERRRLERAAHAQYCRENPF
ncbi:VanZ family protein [Agromyces humi]|uniref:VanZ family protein n=1 Tax=Agromyces humi TaxID=1766800 RepID=UPI00135982ED|nr:VanZ family protein [Agromyces humi]